MAPHDSTDASTTYFQHLQAVLVRELDGMLEPPERDLMRRVLARLVLQADDPELPNSFPLWDARPVVSRILNEAVLADGTPTDIRDQAEAAAAAFSEHIGLALLDPQARLELAEFASVVDDEAMGLVQLKLQSGDTSEPSGSVNASAAMDAAFPSSLNNEGPSAFDPMQAAMAGLDSASDVGAADEMPASIMESETDAVAGFAADPAMMDAGMADPALADPALMGALGGMPGDDLLVGGIDMPDLLPAADMDPAMMGDMMPPELMAPDMPAEMPARMDAEPVPTYAESVPQHYASANEAPVDLYADTSGAHDELDQATIDAMMAQAMAPVDNSVDYSSPESYAEAPLEGVPNFDMEAFAPEALASLEAEMSSAEAMLGDNNASVDLSSSQIAAKGAARAQRTIEELPFEDQIRARMLLISEAVEELAEGDSPRPEPGKHVLETLIENFRAISRPITRSGYRTFASLADGLVNTLEYLRAHPINTPPSLCNNLRELVMTLSEIVDGRWSKYRTFYWLINKLNATMREMEEEVEQLEEQRFFGGSGGGDTLEAQEQEEAKARQAAKAALDLQRAELTDLQEIFVQEANEHIDLLNRNLLLAEKNPNDPEIIYSLMRSAHSVKGSANIAKFTHIGGLAHVMEDVMVAIRDHNLAMTPAIIDLLLASVDRLSAMLASVEYNKAFDEKSVDKLKGQLKTLSEELQTFPDKYRASAAAVDAQLQEKIGLKLDKKEDDKKEDEKAKAAKEATQVRVDIEDLNLLRNLAAELVINRTRLSGQLDVLRSILDGYTREKKSINGLLMRMDRALVEISRELGELFSSQSNMDHLSLAGGTRTLAGATSLYVASSRMAAIQQSMRRLLRVKESGMLGDFSETEFDRFSELDIVWRDMRESATHMDDLGDRFELVSNDLDQNISRISNIANDLHEQIMRVRMIPISLIFNRFPRTVRDTARRLNKKIELAMVGEDTPLDKMIIEEIGDPLMHLVRNSMDHGIESPEERTEMGKPEHGTISLEARQEGNQVLIIIKDDGRGIDVEAVKAKAIERGLITVDQAERASDTDLINLIFLPGFSTAKATTDISGRGVGMDVVKTVITRMKGTVSIQTELGAGTRMTIRLPLTLAISQALLFTASAERFAIPLSSVDETLMIREDALLRTMGQEVIKLRSDILPVLRLTGVLGMGTPEASADEKPVIVINTGQRRVGVIVDRLIGREEIVVKNLGRHLRKLRYVSGGTILGDGEVTLILDIFQIVDQAKSVRSTDFAGLGGGSASRVSFDSASYTSLLEETRQKVAEAKPIEAAASAEADVPTMSAPAHVPGGAHHILVVDDSISIRRFVGSILENAGYHVTLANDGVDALEKLKAGRFDLILTDLEMPRMHGYELIAEVKQNIAYKNIPIIILTGRAGEKHSRKGMELGAAAFLVKPFNEQELLAEIRNNVATSII